MRRLAVLLALAALLPASVQAQGSGSIGLGLGLQNSNILLDEEFEVLGSLTPNVYVPIVIGNGIIVEPGIGLLRIKRTEESEFGDSEFTLTAMRLGVGVLFVLASPERGRIYAGPRVGVMRLKSVSEFEGDDSETSRMDLLFSAVLGGEFFLMPAFSLGGEAGLTYLSMGDTEFDPEPPVDENEDVTLLSLGTEFRVRWYIH